MLKEGDKVGRFIVEGVLGEGGMGIVYKARDEHLGRKIAVKVVAAAGDPECSARILREARLSAALDHPNAVTIFEGGEIDGEPYIAMELVPGQTLRSYVGDTNVPVARKVRYLVEAARALEAAHRAGIVHRDVKPENVMVRPDGRIKVLDFGIARQSGGAINVAGTTAKALVSTLTAQGSFVGTPMYVSPEQLKGKPADGRSDQFAWGVVAYELLEGKAPWTANDALGIVATMMSDPPNPMENAGVPEQVRTVVMRALSTAPAARFGSMQDIIELLEPFAEAESKADTPIVAKAPTSSKNNPDKPETDASGRRYSTQELGQVIAVALERKAEVEARGGKYDFNDLKAAAQEVGIDENDLREALSSLQPVAAPLAVSTVNRRLRAEQRLKRHAAIWGVFFFFFFMLNMLTPGPLWFFFPMLCWGIGLGIHAVTYFFPVDRTPEEEEEHRLRRERRREKRMRRSAQKGALEPPAKVRIAKLPAEQSGAEDEEALAEEEAMAEARGAARRNASTR